MGLYWSVVWENEITVNSKESLLSIWPVCAISLEYTFTPGREFKYPQPAFAFPTSA